MMRSAAIALLPALVITALAMYCGTRQPVPDAPQLFDRYAESWGGKSGESIPLLEGLRLPATVGTRQMFTPSVCAPEATALSNVGLSVCLPIELSAGLVTGWTHQGQRNGCILYSVRFTVPVNRGTCGNPQDAIFFTPTAAGRHQIQYSISSVELPEFHGSFIVEAK